MFYELNYYIYSPCKYLMKWLKQTHFSRSTFYQKIWGKWCTFILVVDMLKILNITVSDYGICFFFCFRARQMRSGSLRDPSCGWVTLRTAELCLLHSTSYPVPSPASISYCGSNIMYSHVLSTRRETDGRVYE